MITIIHVASRALGLLFWQVASRFQLAGIGRLLLPPLLDYLKVSYTKNGSAEHFQR